MRVRLARAAAADADRIFTWLKAESPAAPLRFSAALEAGVRRLRQFPDIGHPVPNLVPELEGLRTWPLPGFPAILLVYASGRSGVDVFRVLHGARDLPEEIGRAVEEE